MTVPPAMPPAQNPGSEITLFDNGEFRLEFQPDGAGGFLVDAPTVARQLGFREAHDLLRNIPAGEKGSALARTPNGGQRTYLTEAGFYRALGQRQAARIPDAAARDFVERFQSWVFGDVLPKLRRGELVPAAPARPAIPQTLSEALRLAADEHDRANAAEQKVAELAPAAESWNTLATAAGDLAVADAAKLLSRDPAIKIGRDRLFTILRDLGWVYRQRVDQRHRAYQSAIDAGRLMELPSSHYHPRTGDLVLDPPQVRVTVKGLEWLHQHLRASQDVALRGGAA